MENDSETGKLEQQGSKPECSKMFSTMYVAMVTASIVSSVSPQLRECSRTFISSLLPLSKKWNKAIRL